MDLVRKALSSVSPENSFGDASCFRKVYTFSWGGKKYVMKVDNKFLWKEEETGFCFHEHEKWKSWSQYSRGRKWLAPILASGQIKRPCQPPSNEKESWVVMPKLQPLPNVLRSSCNYSLERYLREKSCPNFGLIFQRQAGIVTGFIFQILATIFMLEIGLWIIGEIGLLLITHRQ